MDILLKSDQDCMKTFQITVPVEEIQPLFEEAAREVREKAALPGFRAGKVPLDLIKTRFRKEIREEILEHQLPKWAREVDEKHKVNPVVEPYVTELKFEEGEPFSCEMMFEVAPEVPAILDYATTVEVPKIEIPEDRVQGAVDGLRERAATLKPLEDGAQEGDFAEVSLQKKGQSKPFPLFRVASSASEHPLDGALLGKKAGDVFPLTVTPAADSKARTLAPGEYSITVTRVARREIPAADDDLAKTFGVETLETLKSKVREDIEAEVRGRSRQIQEEKVVEELLKRHPFPLPPTQVERQLRGDLEEFASSLASRGVDPSKSLDWEKVAQARRPQAERQVHTYYILEAVAEREALKVAEEELDAYFEARAATIGKPEATAKSLKEGYVREGRLDSLRHMLLHRKALDLLLSKASVTFTDGVPRPEEEIHAPDSDGGGADQPR
jgi:trigger factor